MSAPTPSRDMPAMPPEPRTTSGSGSPFMPSAGARRDPDAVRSGWRRIPLAPAEGWITIGLIFALVMPVAWSISDARWVLGKAELTAFLPWMVVGGVAWGVFAAKVGWGRWRTHVLGAVVAALVLPVFVGATVDPAAGGIAGYFRTTASSTVEAILDLSVRNRTVTQEFGHYLLVLGIITWATGQFAAYATLAHRRPLGAVFVTGLVLLTNMSITRQEQLPFLVVFSLAALCLLVRLHADEERLSWLHRRIGDPAAVTRLYLRGGAVFVAIAIAGSLFLTSVAASAPLAGAFKGVDEQLVNFGQSLQRYLPFGGPGTKLSGVAFGPNASITGLWVTDTTPAFDITVPVGDTTSYYWGAYAYDKFEQTGWSISQNVRNERAAEASILDGTGDAVTDPKFRQLLTFSVRNLGFAGSQIFSPDAPATVSVKTNVTLVGNAKYFAALEATEGYDSYTATALVPKISKTGSDDGLTANQLRASSRTYPAEIEQDYLAVPAGTLGRESLKLLDEIQATARLIAKAAGSPAVTPWDLAEAAVAVLRSPEFTYKTDVTSLATQCSTISIVECFAAYKEGYCQYYATTMAILLRQAGVPTRLVQGWLPGGRDPKTGIEEILRSNSHAWVEVFFPGYGWYPFDPTGNGQTQPAALPAGPVVPTAVPATPKPLASRDDGKDPKLNGGATGTITTPPRGGSTTPGFIVIGVLLIVSFIGLGFIAYRRGPRGPTHPETVWDGIVGLAGRFGWAPRPTQTPFEYAGALGDVLPVARSDLHVVASAKVEVAYGRRELDMDRLTTVRAAQRRLRVVLLRLLLRRPKRPKIRMRRA